MERKKVNLFVIGAMKAGTTSFVDLLSKHPDVYVPPIKEPHFFVDELPNNLYEPSRFFDLDQYLENDFPAPLHITKVTSSSQYDILFSLSQTQKYLCDASTGYLHCPDTAAKIKQYNSIAKIVVILRDPIKRAYSHYKMDLALGRTKTSFEDLLKKEVELYKKDALPWNSYLGMSFYKNALKSYSDNFKEVLILRFEYLMKDDQLEWKKLFEFLEISEFDNFSMLHKNKTRMLHFQKLFYMMKQVGLKDIFSKFVRSNLKRKLFELVSSDKSIEMKVSAEIYSEINDIFKTESPEW